MKTRSMIFLTLLALGCAKVSVETTKPIQVDINMRVDIYQHVEKDVESINDQIYGDPAKQINFLFGARNAYAQDSGALDEAIQNRKTRVATIEGYFAKGYIGENKDALLETRGSVPAEENADVQSAISAENNDRNVIYSATAQKNNTDIAGVRKVFLDKDYQRAPSGYWFQVYDQSAGNYAWKQK
ncbi:DUF1318 domain-containing protein [Candidatus Omnitrophota bacterium]